jgi:hypothetical protein
LGGGDGNQRIEFCHPICIERIQGAPKCIIIKVLGFDPRSNEPVGRFVLKKPGYEVQLLVHKTQAVEDHRLDGVAHGDYAGLGVLPDGLINDRANAKFIEHPGHQAEMIQALTAIGLWHSRLLRRGDSTDMPKLRK